TTASVSPSARLKSRSETALTSVSWSWKVTSRSSTTRTSAILAVLGVKRVAQAVADIGEADEHDDEEGGGSEEHPRQRLGNGRAERDQRAERSLRLLHAEPEIGEEALGDDDFRDG